MGVDGEDITVGELARRLARMEHESQTGFASIHRRLDELNYVHPETLAMQMQLEQAHREDAERRITTLEAENRARQEEAAANRRLAISSIIAPLIVGVLVALIVAAVLGSG